jgi:hypothetical protein
MTIDLITIIALAIFSLGVYCRNCVLNDRCANLEAMNRHLRQEIDDAAREMDRLSTSNRRHVLETTQMALTVQQLHRQAQLERAQGSGVAVGVLWGNN